MYFVLSATYDAVLDDGYSLVPLLLLPALLHGCPQRRLRLCPARIATVLGLCCGRHIWLPALSAVLLVQLLLAVLSHVLPVAGPRTVLVGVVHIIGCERSATMSTCECHAVLIRPCLRSWHCLHID